MKLGNTEEVRERNVEWRALSVGACVGGINIRSVIGEGGRKETKGSKGRMCNSYQVERERLYGKQNRFVI